jgi:AhpD family alkylhydroperoxidase
MWKRSATKLYRQEIVWQCLSSMNRVLLEPVFNTQPISFGRFDNAIQSMATKWLLTSTGQENEQMRSKSFLIMAALLLMLPVGASADEALDKAKSEMKDALGTVPPFIALLPEGAQVGAWSFWKGSSGNPNGKIPAKYRELIALGVAAQIPCAYCAYAHTAFAKANGATDAEIQEAIAYGAEVRLWSTILNGSQYDMSKWKLEIDGIVDHVASAQKNN